jgi:hypothetical protein
MNKHEIWIHPGTYTYRNDPPDKLLETIWRETSGWGYLKCRDMWVRYEGPALQLSEMGYALIKGPSDPGVSVCPYCGLYMMDIPGSLMSKHLAKCGGNDENWNAIEETIITEQRRVMYEAKINAERLRLIAEQEEEEKRERQDRIREELLARQLQKDRKKRIKQEARETLRNR